MVSVTVIKNPLFIKVVSGAFGMFPQKIRAKWLLDLVTYPCAFRLRRLAQNGRRSPGARHFPFKLPHKTALVTCDMSMFISTAQARTKRVPRS